MRILLVGSGASYSTKDVEIGVHEALVELGHEVKLYSLEQRLGICDKWMKMLWKHKGKKPEEKPTWADTAYRASIEALEMALRFDVDWVLGIAGRYLHPDAVWMMRRAGLRVALLLTESPYEDQGQALITSLMNVAWTNERASLAFLQEVNPNVYYSPHAYRPNVHKPLNGEDTSDIPEYDVVFVGTDFIERIELLGGVDWTGINLGLFGYWTLLPSRHRLRKHLVSSIITNDYTAKVYQKAKIGLNLHRASMEYSRHSYRIPQGGAESLNPRGFELAACGAFHLSDVRKEGTEIFGDSVLTFTNAEELESLVRTALQDEGLRQRKTEEAMQKVQPYTYTAKVEQMIRELEAHGN